MKHLASIACVLLATCAVSIAQTDTGELIAAERHFSDVLIRGDWRGLEQVEADDLIFTNADGSVTHKSDDVRGIRSGSMKFESIEMSDTIVKGFGDVAVVCGKLIEKAHYNATNLSGTYRFTDIWAKRNGRWQLVAGQETLQNTP